MSINFDKLVRTLPCDDSSSSRRQRDNIWEKWDTNFNGFLSVSEIETEFLVLFGIQPDINISEIIKKSSDDTKRKLNSDGKLG